jgi:hypothetical protein
MLFSFSIKYIEKEYYQTHSMKPVLPWLQKRITTKKKISLMYIDEKLSVKILINWLQ